MNKSLSIIAGLSTLMLTQLSSAQEIIQDEKQEELKEIKVDSTKLIKVDGVAAVVGDFVVLDSDIDKQFAQLEASGVSTKDISFLENYWKTSCICIMQFWIVLKLMMPKYVRMLINSWRDLHNK